MLYLLDTNVCVDYLTGRYPNVTKRLQSCPKKDLCLSSIVASELRYGADKSMLPDKNHARLDTLLDEIRCFAFDLQTAAVYGRVRATLESRGTPIGPDDLQIAAHALQLDAVLVSDNLREFQRVEGLRVESWR